MIGSAKKLRGWRLLALACWLSACTEAVEQPVGSAAGARSGGNGGSAAGAGTGGAAQLDPPVPWLVVPCGTARCVSPAEGFGFITACCADEGRSTCGTKSPGGDCNLPPAGDPRCPALNFRGLISVPSCCTAAGACGLDGTMYGVPGCTDLASAAVLASATFVIGASVPDARPCDPVKAAHADADADAGRADAGD